MSEEHMRKDKDLVQIQESCPCDRPHWKIYFERAEREAERTAVIIEGTGREPLEIVISDTFMKPIQDRDQLAFYENEFRREAQEKLQRLNESVKNIVDEVNAILEQNARSPLNSHLNMLSNMHEFLVKRGEVQTAARIVEDVYAFLDKYPDITSQAKPTDSPYIKALDSGIMTYNSEWEDVWWNERAARAGSVETRRRCSS